MAKRNRKPRAAAGGRRPDAPQPIAGLRIIGGRFRGRRLHYSGDLRTRPMKDRLREAIFNLVGPSIRGTHALDLFAGTGALALEALSRGAHQATLVEQHYPTANVIRQNVATLGVEGQAEIVVGNVFIWWKRQAKGCHAHACRGHEEPVTPMTHAQPNMPTASVGMAPAPDLPTCDNPWVVFCSPPYDFYVERIGEILELIAGLTEAAPAGSVFVVEADARFDFGRLLDPQAWDVRSYPPAVVGIFRKE
jgi:16S rRNA (guanine966-N2)-methyltransferase